MISAKIIVDCRSFSKKHNGYPIKIRVYDQVNTHRYISLKLYQSEKTKEVIKTALVIQRELKLHKEIEYCNYHNLNLEESLEIISNGVPEDDTDSKILYLEKELQRLKSKNSQTKYIEFFKDFINEYKIIGKTTDRLEISNKKFLEFLNSRGVNLYTFLLNDIDYELLNAYKIFCINQGLADSSITSYFNNLKLIYKEAQKRQSLYIKQDNPFEKIKFTASKRVQSRDIAVNDLKVFFNLTSLSNYPSADFKFRRTMNLMKLQFLIGGHDFIEIANLKWSNIDNGRVKFYRYKNRSKGGGPLIDNMLHPLSLEIIEEYGIKHDKRIFSFLPDPETDLKAHHQNNKLITTQLKAIKKHNNLDFDVRTKFLRYSFRTIAGNLMINQMVLEKIMGHSNNSMSMGYQGATPYEIQDAEHLRIISEVFE